MENRFCKKCLLDKVFDEQEYTHMKEYINGIDSYIKTSEIEYKRRLDICMECENLFNGICKKCGCFVEVRAAVCSNYCPDIKSQW